MPRWSQVSSIRTPWIDIGTSTKPTRGSASSVRAQTSPWESAGALVKYILRPLERHVNPTRVPIETKESYRWLENLRQSMTLLGAPERCVHVADRESDIYDLFCLAQDLRTRFLMRVQTNRLAEPPQKASPQDADHRVFAQLAASPWSGRHHVAVGGGDEIACLQVKFAAITTLPPIGKRKRYSPQVLTYIQALELDPPADRQPIDWLTARRRGGHTSLEGLTPKEFETGPTRLAPKRQNNIIECNQGARSIGAILPHFLSLNDEEVGVRESQTRPDLCKRDRGRRAGAVGIVEDVSRG